MQIKVRDLFRIDPLGVAMPGPGLSHRVHQIIESRSRARASRFSAVCTFSACAALFITFAFVTLSRAQNSPQDSSPAPYPTFEVASIKPTPSDDGQMNTFLTYPGGTIEARGCMLTYLIMRAYDVQHFQISGGDPWVDRDRFSISAKPPAGSASTKIAPSNPKLPLPQEERLMLRSLLADRFHLVLDQSTQQTAGFALVLKGSAANVRDAKDKETFPVVVMGPTGDADSPWYLQGINAPMTKLAERLAGLLSVPVVDRTGMQGSFDFKVKFSEPNDQNASAPLLKNSVEEIGLKLEPTQVPLLHLQIKQASKPSEN